MTFGYDLSRPVLHEIDFAAHRARPSPRRPDRQRQVQHRFADRAFYQPQRPDLIDGRDIRQTTGDSLHRQIGLVLQSNFSLQRQRR